MRYDNEYKKIDTVIKRNMRLFKKPGVLTVRPGVKMIGGELVDKPGIVITVDKKLKSVSAKNMLPMVVDGYLVDVREGTPMQKLRAHDLESYQLLNEMGPDNVRDPDHNFERTVPDGKLVPPTTPPAKATAKKGTAAKNAKNKPGYEPPTGYALKPVSATMTITTNASPDGGYAALSEFLSETKKKLTVAMYSFTAKALAADVVNAVKPEVDFKMVLDGPPSGTRNPQQTDDQTVTEILKADPRNARVNWALENGNANRGRINPGSGIFPKAYHIKVAVRDSKTFWLSSGNFNNSNQPNIKPADQIKGAYDRDWHVIVANDELAQLFEAYILNDFEVAGAQQASPETSNTEIAAAKVAANKRKADAMRKKEKAAMGKIMSMEKQSSGRKQDNFPPPPSTLGAAKKFANVPVIIQPVLTPDAGKTKGYTQYVEQILNLINSAKKTLYMQFQYIAAYGNFMNSKQAKHPVFMKLLEAVQNALSRNVYVEIIISEFESKWLEPIFEYDRGIYATIKRMDGVHNKGILVDSQKVLVSSQNWSAEGVLQNRDAGVIIDNAEIAGYFEKIFIDDWMFRTKKEPVNPPKRMPKKNEGAKARESRQRRTASAT